METQSGVLTVTGFDPESNFKSGGDLRDRRRSAQLDLYMTGLDVNRRTFMLIHRLYLTRRWPSLVIDSVV